MCHIWPERSWNRIYFVIFSKLFYLEYLSQIITSTIIHQKYTRYKRHKYFHQGNHKGENPTNFLILVSHKDKMTRYNNPRTICLQHLSVPPLLLSPKAHMREKVKCVSNEEGVSLIIFFYWVVNSTIRSVRLLVDPTYLRMHINRFSFI